MKKLLFVFAVVVGFYAHVARATNNCTGATYYDSDTDTCIACPTGYDYNTDAGKTDISQCQIHCEAGTFAPGYTQLEYIESTGTQYIDTGVKPKPGITSAEFTLATTDNTTGQVFGARPLTSSAGTGSYNIFANVSSNQFRLDWVGDASAVFGTSVGTFHDFKLNVDGSVDVDNSHFNNVATKTVCEYNIYLFGGNNAGSPALGKVRYKGAVRIKENGVLVRDFVPVRRDSDGAIGMYDRVTGTFFGNSGSGTFVASPDVINTNCVNVGTGYYAPASVVNFGSTGTRTACPAGTYSNNPNAASINDCTPCAGATYNDETAAASCKSCPTGYDYNTDAGKTDITQCQKHCDGGTYVISPALDGYTQLEYIQGSGTQYIDTGFKPNQNTSAVVTFLAPTNAVGYIFGARDAMGVAAFGSLYTGTSTFRDDYNTDSRSTELTSDFYNQKLVINKQKNSVTVLTDGGTTLYSVTHSAANFQTNYNMIFPGMISGGTAAPSANRFYSFKLYDNGTLIRDFIPARRDFDNVVGMYDRVTGTFFTNAGTGTFIAGSDVGNTCTDVGAGYYAPASTVNFGSTGTRTACPIGTYSDVPNAAACQSCANATYGDETGLSACKSCPTGYDYNTDAGKTDITQCQIHCVGGTTIPEYAELEYIEATGTQWINTGISYGETDSGTANIDIKFHSLTYVGSNAYFQMTKSGSCLTVVGAPTNCVSPYVRNNLTYTLSGKISTLYAGDTLIQTKSWGRYNPSSYYIFNLGGGNVNKSTGRIYSLSLIKNGNLVRDMIPVRRNSDNAIGMYDQVSGSFFGNAGSGTFVAGPDVGNTCTDVGAGYYAPANTVNFGSVGVRMPCPAGTYSDVPNAAACQSCANATYGDETGLSACKSCPIGYDYNTDAGKTSVSQCQTHCNVGAYVGLFGEQCTNVGTGYYAPASTVNFGSTGTRTACPVGLHTVGYGHGADEANDCGRILHIGDYVVYMRRNKETTPALNIQMENGDMFYINLSPTNHNISRLHFEYGGNEYTAYDDSLSYGERNFDTGAQIVQ